MCGKRAKTTAWLILLLLGFSAYSILGVKCDLMLVRRSQFFKYFARNFVQTCLGAPGSGSLRKKKTLLFFSSYGKRLTVVDLFEGLWLVGSRETFSAKGGSPKSLTKELAVSASSTVFMAVSMIPNVWHSSCCCMRHSWLTKFGVIRLTHLVYGWDGQMREGWSEDIYNI